MRARGTIALMAVIGFFAKAALGYVRPNRRRVRKVSTPQPLSGDSVRSPKHQVKGELVDGGLSE